MWPGRGLLKTEVQAGCWRPAAAVEGSGATDRLSLWEPLCPDLSLRPPAPRTKCFCLSYQIAVPCERGPGRGVHHCLILSAHEDPGEEPRRPGGVRDAGDHAATRPAPPTCTIRLRWQSAASSRPCFSAQASTCPSCWRRMAPQ